MRMKTKKVLAAAVVVAGLAGGSMASAVPAVAVSPDPAPEWMVRTPMPDGRTYLTRPHICTAEEPCTADEFHQILSDIGATSDSKIFDTSSATFEPRTTFYVTGFSEELMSLSDLSNIEPREVGECIESNPCKITRGEELVARYHKSDIYVARLIRVWNEETSSWMVKPDADSVALVPLPEVRTFMLYKTMPLDSATDEEFQIWNDNPYGDRYLASDFLKASFSDSDGRIIWTIGIWGGFTMCSDSQVIDNMRSGNAGEPAKVFPFSGTWEQFALADGCMVKPAPEPEPEPEPTPEPEPEPTPTPTPESKPTLEPEPTPTPVVSPTPEPTSEPTPTPTPVEPSEKPSEPVRTPEPTPTPVESSETPTPVEPTPTPTPVEPSEKPSEPVRTPEPTPTPVEPSETPSRPVEKILDSPTPGPSEHVVINTGETASSPLGAIVVISLTLFAIGTFVMLRRHRNG